MLSAKMEEALNKQLNAELYSSYLYLSMSAYFHSAGLPGAANWMRVQAGEELTHSMKFFDYVAAHGRVRLRTVESPPAEWESPVDTFEHVLQHEKMVTELINSLVDLAKAEGDRQTEDFLQWFVEEQEEEEESAEKVLGRIRAVAAGGLQAAIVDRELGERR